MTDIRVENENWACPSVEDPAVIKPKDKGIWLP